MSFKLPIDLIGNNKAVFLVTVEGIYIIGLFEWAVKKARMGYYSHKVSHHEEFYILKSTTPAIKLRRELGALQKELQRLTSKKEDSTQAVWINKKDILAQKAFQLVTAYLKNPPSPVIPFTPPKNNLNMWKEMPSSFFQHNMQSASRRMMQQIGKSMEGKSLAEMRTPQINTLRDVNYVAINYSLLPNRKRKTHTLPSTLLKAMALQYLK